MDAEEWDVKYSESGRLWSEEPNQFVVSEIEDVAPGTALDWAAGEGRNAVWLATNGWTVTAVDFSQVAMGRGQAAAESRGVKLDWIREDILSYRPQGQFDLVLITYLHLIEEQMRKTLVTAAGAVAPGGLLLMIGHALANITDGYGGPPDPAVLATPTQLADWIPGMEIERADHVYRDVETDDGPERAIDLVVRARRQ